MRINLDMIQANKELTDLARSFGLALRDLMYDQGRLLAQGAVRMAKPGQYQQGPAEQKKAGQRATSIGINMLFAPVSDVTMLEDWTNSVMESNADVYRTTKNGTKKLLKRSFNNASLTKMRYIHGRHRTERGGVSFRKQDDAAFGGKHLVPEALFSKYLKDQLKKVGKLKAGFIPAADYFASLVGTSAKSIPSWVRKQSVKLGTYTNAVDRKTGIGSLQVTNTVPYSDIAILDHHIKWLEGIRQSDIEKHAIKRIRSVAKAHNAKYARAA